jgi:hypothetical protein
MHGRRFSEPCLRVSYWTAPVGTTFRAKLLHNVFKIRPCVRVAEPVLSTRQNFAVHTLCIACHPRE